MKKTLSIILCFALILCMASCYTQKEKPDAIGSVSLSINCNVIKDKVDNPVILDNAEFLINEGETVYDILMEAVVKNKLQMETSGAKGSEYVVGINNIYSQAYGDMSGWLFYLNGEMAMTSMAQCKLKPNDKIEILYSTNFGEDLK